MKYSLTLLFVLFTQFAFAQASLVDGKVIHDDTKLPFSEVSVLLKELKMITVTNGAGEFQFSNVAYGNYEIEITNDDGVKESVKFTVNSAHTELGVLTLKSAKNSINGQDGDQSTTNIEDASSEDESNTSASGQNISSVLNASRDAFLSAATFGWGQYFFKIRGYGNDHNTLYLNGVPLNDLEEGGVFYNSWSGLNDVFRGRNVTLGLQPGDCGFGGMGLNTSLDATASNIRKGTRISYSSTNRSYRNRIMLTYASGLQKNGWAYAFSFSRRWAQEGQIAGTFYDAYGYYGAIEKRFKNQGISFMVVGAPIKRGKNGPATAEAFDLAGTNYYNPYWGYQDGKVRNSRVLKTHSPLFILSHDIILNDHTSLQSAISYQTGETAQTGIDWQNAADPRPDYYRYFPSYRDSVDDQQEVYNYIKANPNTLQIQWDSLYEANRNNINSGFGKAAYILNSNVETSRRFNGSVNLKSEINQHATFHTAINFQTQKNHNFLRVEDMLGGGYWENINQFAARTFGGIIKDADKMNVLDKDIKRYEGDSYGFDYSIHFTKASWLAQTMFVYNKFDFFAGAELGYTNFFRVGNYQSGLYTTNSYGKSSTNTFFNPKVKGGITYKLNGRNYFYANGSIGSRAPFVDNVIISPRTRNEQIANPSNEKFSSAEIGYLLRSPKVKARFTFFASDVKNASDIKRFYRDDDYSFVSMALQGINKRYTGIEIGAELKLSPSLTFSAATSLTQAFYTSRPYINIFSDNEIGTINSTASGGLDTVFMKNYYIPSGPQSAAQASLNYRSKSFWYATISFNYMARNWMDFAPTARTRDGVDNLPYQSEAWNNAISQKKLPNVFTVDLNCGKSFKLDKYYKKAGNQTFLLFNMGITNLLNNQNINLYGFENLRVNTENPEWFAPRYAYALGIQYFLNLSLRF
ncbi:MAG: hypothetical protein IPI46_01860 [Bacteroidetes bacterium]|nr:hypothetical protein [Bacteroidota bacterium]